MDFFIASMHATTSFRVREQIPFFSLLTVSNSLIYKKPYRIIISKSRSFILIFTKGGPNRGYGPIWMVGGEGHIVRVPRSRSLFPHLWARTTRNKISKKISTTVYRRISSILRIFFSDSRVLRRVESLCSTKQTIATSIIERKIKLKK